MQIGQQVQLLQTIKQFASARLNYSPVYREVIKELESISASLNVSKLTIQIFSRFSPLAQGLYNFLNSNQALQQRYQVKISQFPTILPAAQPNSLPTVLLKANPAIGQQEIRYELSINQSILIGRDRQRLSQDFCSHNSHFWDLPNYSKVSSVHAQIQAVTIPGSTSNSWQNCDLNSTNGTYVNGQRIQGCKTLQPEDKITLAYPSATEKAPELIFQIQSNLAVSTTQLRGIIDCDLVGLVVAPQQLLSDEEKKIIDIVSKAKVAGLFIIADSTGSNDQTLQKLNSEMETLGNWLQVQYPLLASDTFITHLQVYPFHSSISLTSLSPTAQQHLNSFCQNVLIQIAQTKSQDIRLNRINRVAPILVSQTHRIEQLVNTQEQALKTYIQRTEQLLKNRSLETWNEQIRKVFKQVLEDREDFFRQARNELGQARTDLSSPLIPNSLMQRIEQYTDTLQPVVTRPNGQVCIQLQLEGNSNTHQVLISFCQSQLIQWATQEWERFCNVYNSGGLNRLLQDSYNMLNILPSLALSNSFNSPASQIDIRTSLQGSFVEMQNSTSYYEGSGDIFGTTARFGMQAALAAGMAFISPVSAAIQGANLVVSLTGIVGSRLNSSQVQKLKLEQQVTALKRTASIHYQALARYMLDRVLQNISTAIDIEDRKFRKALEATEKQITDYLNQVRLAQEEYRVRQQSLSQDKAALEQIKRMAI